MINLLIYIKLVSSNNLWIWPTRHQFKYKFSFKGPHLVNKNEQVLSTVTTVTAVPHCTNVIVLLLIFTLYLCILGTSLEL